MLETLVFFFHAKNFMLTIFFSRDILTVIPKKGNPEDGLLSCASSSIGLTRHVSGVPCYHVKFLFMCLGVFRDFCDVCGNASIRFRS